MQCRPVPFRSRRRWSPLLLSLVVLAGCGGARAPDRAAVQAPANDFGTWEPAPVPRVSERRVWRYPPNPARAAYGWPDRWTGAPAGGPFRPRF